MVLAAQTTASPAAIWAIVIVAVAVLAFWLVSIFLADRSQVRASGRSRTEAWPAYAEPWARGDMTGAAAAEVPGQAAGEPPDARGGHAGDEPVPQGEAPTRADIPAQPAPGARRPAMPAQRTGEGDRPKFSNTGPGYAGQGPQEDEDRDQDR
jgi:hypothetical protein